MKDIEDLHAAWHHWNQLFFDGELPPATRFTLRKLQARALALYSHTTREIILPAEFFADFRKGPIASELAAHVELHEMCHAWVNEVRGEREDDHGATFGLIANRVGPRLWLPPCRPEDLWCWPDHPREGAQPYDGLVRSHGEIMHERLWDAARCAAGARWRLT